MENDPAVHVAKSRTGRYVVCFSQFGDVMRTSKTMTAWPENADVLHPAHCSDRCTTPGPDVRVGRRITINDNEAA